MSGRRMVLALALALACQLLACLGLRGSWRPARAHRAGKWAAASGCALRATATKISGLAMVSVSSDTTSSSSSSSSNSKSKADSNSKIDLLYDSECPICMMEVNFLQKRDVQGRIRFTDLSSPNYNPAEHGNVTFKEGMRKLRAVLPGGEVITGVEVFRKTYDAIGLGWVFALTNYPVIGGLADKVYDVWAENRLRLTGRPDLAEQLAERSKTLAEMEPVDECDMDGCAIDWEAESGGDDADAKSPSGNWEQGSGKER